MKKLYLSTLLLTLFAPNLKAMPLHPPTKKTSISFLGTLLTHALVEYTTKNNCLVVAGVAQACTLACIFGVCCYLSGSSEYLSGFAVACFGIECHKVINLTQSCASSRLIPKIKSSSTE